MEDIMNKIKQTLTYLRLSVLAQKLEFKLFLAKRINVRLEELTYRDYSKNGGKAPFMTSLYMVTLIKIAERVNRK